MICGAVKFGFTLSISPAIPATAGALTEVPHGSTPSPCAEMASWQPGAARWIHEPCVDQADRWSYLSVPATA